MDPVASFNFEGKVVLVTGCAQGLGKEIALGFARSGASLVLADLQAPEETAEEIERIGAPCIAVTSDIAAEEDVENLVSQSITEYSNVHILINNAGISQMTYTPTEELPVEEWDRIIRVNLRGTFLCSKLVGREMIKRGGGAMVNIASTSGITGVPRAPAYCASKAGIILLTKSLALEWAGYNIRVNAVAPHYLETGLTQGLIDSEKVYKGLTRYIPLKRFGRTGEVVGAVLLLSSGASTFTTGTVLTVDGGYLAQ